MLQELLRIIQSNPISTFALIVSIGALVTSWKTRTATLYSDIDARYMELLKLSITNADFVNPDITNNYKSHFKDKKALLAYEQYAYAAWNIVETIFDRRGKLLLRRTWDPVIKEENRLHRAWLNQPENRHKFKEKFLDFMIQNNKKFPCPMSGIRGREEKCPCNSCEDLRALVKSKDENRIVPRQLDAPK